jgi:hypothetical protein
MWFGALATRGDTVYNNSRGFSHGDVMPYRNPVVVIDETIENLVYLTDWFIEDIDQGALDRGFFSNDTVRSIAALRASRALLPRLRIVRSNYISAPLLPDARNSNNSLDSALIEYVERSADQLRKFIKDP